MTLTIAIKSAEGIVLASESRATVDVRRHLFDNAKFGYYDSTHKLLPFRSPNTFAGALAYGVGTVNRRTAYHLLPDFEAQLPPERLSVEALANRLSSFLLNLWPAKRQANLREPDMGFAVAGYNEGEAYGRLYTFLIPSKPTPTEQFSEPEAVGMIHGGYGRIVDRLLRGYDETLLSVVTGMGPFSEDQRTTLPGLLEDNNDLIVPFESMPLQACVDFAVFLIRTTIDAQRFSVGLRNCGGPIEVATITRHMGLQVVQHMPS